MPAREKRRWGLMPDSEEMLAKVRAALLRYPHAEVRIVVFDRLVVQLDVTEKERYDKETA